MDVKWASRIAELPPYLFAEIDAKNNELKNKGVDGIDLGVGDHDIHTPDFIIDSLKLRLYLDLDAKAGMR